MPWPLLTSPTSSSNRSLGSKPTELLVVFKHVLSPLCMGSAASFVQNVLLPAFHLTATSVSCKAHLSREELRSCWLGYCLSSVLL